MDVITKIENKNQSPIALTIGSFDGIHFGHQKIINDLIAYSKKNGLRSALMTFMPSPKSYFTGKNNQIMGLREKVNYLSELNLDVFILCKFNKFFEKITAEHFLDQMLIDKLNVKSIFVGKDFKFGHQRRGSIDLLNRYHENKDIELVTFEPITKENERVSSSLIREKIINNDFKSVEKLLCRNLSVSGNVFHGDKMGRTIDFPTINIKYKSSLLNGVYEVTTLHKGKQYIGLANIGLKPTVKGINRQFEAYLLDFKENVYGEYMKFDILSKVRDTMKFKSLEDLQLQIKTDIKNLLELQKKK